MALAVSKANERGRDTKEPIAIARHMLYVVMA